jgi:anaerobic selenocysteine-containing dehydrogenase
VALEAAMSDRITDPWGARTPTAAGGAWPVRVDQFLEDGVSEQDVDRWVQSACVLCSNGCGLDVAVRDGRMVGVRGRAEDRVNHGRLGPKGLFGWQANHAPDRLTRPLVREGGSLVASDWDTAMGRLVDRSKELLAEAGGGSIGVYNSGQLFLEEYYTLGVLVKAGLGSPHLDGNTRLCTALDLRAAAVGAVVWCTGYAGDFPWLPAGLVDAGGRPRHRDGAAPLPGVWYVGLRWLTHRASGNFLGFPADAGTTADAVAAYLEG